MNSDPDLKLAEKLVMDAFGWDVEQAGAHYAVYQRSCQAVVKAVLLERNRSAVVAGALVRDSQRMPSWRDVYNAIIAGPPKENT